MRKCIVCTSLTADLSGVPGWKARKIPDPPEALETAHNPTTIAIPMAQLHRYSTDLCRYLTTKTPGMQVLGLRTLGLLEVRISSPLLHFCSSRSPGSHHQDRQQLHWPSSIDSGTLGMCSCSHYTTRTPSCFSM